MERNRIVITGLSAITPIGTDFDRSWEALLAGKSGIGRISAFDTTDFSTHIAGEVRDFVPDPDIPPKQLRKMDRFTQFALCAGLQAVRDSGCVINESNAARIGIITGVGLGGMKTFEDFHSKLVSSGPGRVSPFYIPMIIANMAPAQIAIFTGAKGINSVCTSACASALHAIGTAFDQILLGRADMVVAGGAEATITDLGISGFTSMKALCTSYQDEPERASRPFDRDRAGFVMGEGSAMLVLERLDSALARGAHIYAEIAGFGASDDAHHMVAPLDTGEGMAAAMTNALSDAGLAPEAIGHISAHGTSTHANDAAETKAVRQVFGSHAEKIAISAVKSQIGHMLGAAGAAASVFAAKTLETGIVPGTLNLEHPDPECDLDYMAGGAAHRNPEYAMVNAFGFGGTNASIIFRKFSN